MSAQNNILQLLNRAVDLHQAGHLSDAASIYKTALLSDPHNTDALRLLGTLHYQQGNHLEALRLIEFSLKLSPRQPEAWNNRGNALRGLKRYTEALASYDAAIALKSGYADAYDNRGVILQDLQRYGDALASFDKAIALKADFAAAHNNRGNVLLSLERLQEALASFDKAIALKPDSAEAYSNRSHILQEMKRYPEAMANCEKAIALNPGLAEAYNNQGVTLRAMKRYSEALASFDKAIALKADLAEAYCNHGNTLQELKQYIGALASYDKAIALKPDSPYLWGNWLSIKMHLCGWQGIDAAFDTLAAGIEAGKPLSQPFGVLVTPLSLPLQRTCAEIYVQHKHPAAAKPLWQGERYSHAKIRIAYVSADFCDHPVSQLLASVLEKHDRTRFELYGISLMPEDASPTGQRVKAAFDRFIDVSKKNDQEVAQLMRDLEIDIAVDLMGFTMGCRATIFAHRPAPVQVNYLGYPGTMGANYIDYIIADAVVMPPQSWDEYSEKIVCLPDCFQPNDDKKIISQNTPSRASQGLPEEGFVFCCFNNSYKITPDVFDIWMRLLKKVDGSVLWLSGVKPGAAENLYAEAGKRGIEKQRLIFAGRVPDIADHLARYRLADLFLDTFYYNAHATASDALWTGLPVLTCPGETFAARVAASLLNAVGLPEMITHSHAEYEALALELATQPKRLAAIKEKLAHNRTVYPLFDTARFTKQLEDAYIKMWERSQAGLLPDHIG